MNNAMHLPKGFEDLGELASQWARPSESERDIIRWSATASDFSKFHATMIPRLAAVLSSLEQCSIKIMNEAQTNLFCLAAAFAEAAPHHELFGGSADVPHSFSARRFVAGHGKLPAWEIP